MTEARVYLAGHLAGSLGACCHLAQVATAQLVGEVRQGWVGMCEHTLGGERAAWLPWAEGVLANVTEQMAADPRPEVTRVLHLLQAQPGLHAGAAAGGRAVTHDEWTGWTERERRLYLRGHLAGAMDACSRVADRLGVADVERVLRSWVGLNRRLLGEAHKDWRPLAAWASSLMASLARQMRERPEGRVLLRLIQCLPSFHQGQWRPREG
jgi:hypothetical protein